MVARVLLHYCRWSSRYWTHSWRVNAERKKKQISGKDQNDKYCILNHFDVCRENMKITEEAEELKDDQDSTIGGTVAEVLVSWKKHIDIIV